MARKALRPGERRITPFTAGVIFLVVTAVIVYLGFTKGEIPGVRDFRVRAVVEDANSIKPTSPVRIAGVNVGQVSSIEPFGDTNLSVVTFELQDRGLPVRADARLKIRPRTFLEGNFFVELYPGSPSARELPDDATIPVTRTAGPVRFDEVLTTFQADTRRDLQTAVEEFGTALRSRPGPDSGEPDVTAAEAVNRSFDNAPTAFRDGSIVAEAFQGRSQGDLGDLIDSTGELTESLASNSEDLRRALRGFNTFSEILSDEQVSLRRTFRLLPGTLREADGAFDALNRSFPPVRAFSRELRPSIREIPATIDASRPFIRSTRRLLQPNALRGWVAEVRPGIRDLARLTQNTTRLMPQVELLSKCLTRTILPTGDIRIEDGPFTSGVENYKQFWYALAGINGEGQNFDGNGNYVRFQVGGGDQTVSLGTLGGGGASELVGNFLRAPQGTRPVMPRREPPLRRDVDCFTQPVPDVNGAPTGRGDGSTAPARARTSSDKVDADQERAQAAEARSDAAAGDAPAAAPAERSAAPAQPTDAGLTSGDGLASELGQRLNPFGGAR